jgi:hypothetical protein
MNKYISLKLAKLLSENWCELESEYVWIIPNTVCSFTNKPEMHNKEKFWPYSKRLFTVIPAYDILNDICLRYKDEFFWDAYGIHTETILADLQDWVDRKDIEEYIWLYCRFRKKPIN